MNLNEPSSLLLIASKMKIVSLILLLLPISCSSSNNKVEPEERCYEDCEGFGLWLYGRGWIIPPYDAEVVGKCLQRPSTQGNAGQGDAGQNALVSIYDGVVENVDMLTPSNDTNDTSQEVIARGLSLASEATEVPNSEGMYYCIVNKDANREAFFWVVNCNVLAAEDGSGNSNLCEGIRDDERSAVEGGLQGYFVDGTDKQFIRYLFNETHAIKTEVQPIGYIGVDGYSCSGRDWYQQGMQCTDPAKVLCPIYFQGTQGLGTFQSYGDKSQGIVVSQDIATRQLCECVDDLDCDTGVVSSANSMLWGSPIIIFGCTFLLGIVVFG